MADARELLRRAKVQRPMVNSPLAAYSSGGVLSCRVCRTPVPGDWDAHCHSRQHIQALKDVKSVMARREAVPAAAAPSPSPAPADASPSPPPAVPVPTTAIAAALPPGFFDDPATAPAEAPAGAPAPSGALPAAAGGLPQDFFDNPSEAPAASDPAQVKEKQAAEWREFKAFVAEATAGEAEEEGDEAIAQFLKETDIEQETFGIEDRLQELKALHAGCGTESTTAVTATLFAVGDAPASTGGALALDVLRRKRQRQEEEEEEEAADGDVLSLNWRSR